MTAHTQPLTDAHVKEVIESIGIPKVNGPAMAALIAAGIGSATLGVLTTGAVISAGLKSFLAFNSAVGPLSGKTTYAVAAYLASWIILTLVLRGKDVSEKKSLIATFALIGVGVLGTFPLFFDLFAK